MVELMAPYPKWCADELDRLRDELTNARLERDDIASLNSSLIGELAEARRALLAGNDTVLANKKLQEDNAALKARIAVITQALETSCANVTNRDARIAGLEEKLAGINGLHGQMYEAWSDERARAERAEAERDEERLMRKLYEDAAKHWQSLAECAEAEIAEAMDLLCYTADECNLVTACEHWVANFHEANVRAERAEAALSFYADEINWHTPPHCYSAAVSDCGTKARAALAPSPAGQVTCWKHGGTDTCATCDCANRDPSPAGREG